MAKKKVRTTAQRRAAAKAAWEIRKAKEAMIKATQPATASSAPTSGKLPPVDFGGVGLAAPTASTAVATQEGSEYYVTVAIGGSLFRHKLSRDTVRSLGLDCIKLAG